MALSVLMILFYLSLIVAVVAFVKLSNIEINKRKVISLRYRILISILFPLILFLIFLISSLIIALILIIIVIIILLFLFSRIKIRYRQI